MIKNYSTVVPAERTAGEIAATLVRNGARSITNTYDARGVLTGIAFVMPVAEASIQFELPVNTVGVAAVMLRDKPWSKVRRTPASEYEGRIQEQAKWVAWRILRDWVEAQLALIESGQAVPAQVFMPYAVNAGRGQTMYQLWYENNQKQLGSGE